MQTQPVRVIVRLPYNRPEHPFPDPVPVLWTPEKENYLWEVVAKSRGSEAGAPNWKALATRLDVPLPYLLYRAQVRYEQDLRGLQVIKGSLSPPSAQGGPQHTDGPSGSGDSPKLLRRNSGASRRENLAKLSTSIRLTTPLGVRARLNSLSSNSPSRMNKPSSSSVLTLRGGHRRDQTVFRPGTPLSSESESDEEDERQEEAERRLEEQEALDNKLRNLHTLLTGDNVGLVSSTKENRKGKEPQNQGRVPPGSPQIAGANTGDSGRSSQSVSSASSPRGSIPSIPSPPQESSQSLTSRHIAPAKPAVSSSATSPGSGQGTRTQPLMRYGPSVKATSGSSASSFSDMSEASLNSELESAFSSNIRGGGSRFSHFSPAHLAGRGSGRIV